MLCAARAGAHARGPLLLLCLCLLLPGPERPRPARAQVQQTYEEALAQDPTAFDYDGV